MCKNTWLSAWIKFGLKAEPLLTFKCVSVRATEQTDTFLNDVWWVFSGLIRSRRTNRRARALNCDWSATKEHPHHTPTIITPAAPTVRLWGFKLSSGLNDQTAWQQNLHLASSSELQTHRVLYISCRLYFFTKASNTVQRKSRYKTTDLYLIR